MNLAPAPFRPPFVVVVALCLLAMAPFAAQASIADRSAEEHIERALEFKEADKLDSAVIELKNALKQEPKNVFARTLLGNVLFELGNYGNASKNFRRARKLGAPKEDWIVLLSESLHRLGLYEDVLEVLKNDAEFPNGLRASLYTARGNAQRGLKKMMEARRSFNEALDHAPNHAGAFIGLASIQIQNGKLDKAEEWLAKAKASAQPDDRGIPGLEGDLAMALGDTSRAEVAYRTLADASRRDSLAQLPLSHALILNHKYDEAIARLHDVLSQRPKHPNALRLRMIAAYETRDFERALGFADRLLSIIPDHLPTQFIAAAASYSLEQYNDAHRYLTAILGLRPAHVAARRLLGKTLIRMGRSGKAMEVLQPLADEGDVDVLAIIGIAAISNQNLQAGRDYLERYNELRPNDGGVLAKLGMVRLELGDLEEGVAALEEAASINPEQHPAKIALFALRIREGKIGEALSIARQVQQETPEAAIGFTMEGTVQDAAGDTEAARKAYETALALKPGDPATSTNLARIARRQGNIEEARDYLRKVLALDPAHAATLMMLARIETESHNPDAARKLFENAAAAQPDAVIPRIMLARMHLTQDQPAEALGITQQLVASNGNNSALLEVVGKAQMLTGQYRKAQITYRDLVRLRPGVAQLHHMLAAAYNANGDALNYEDELHQALKIDPGYAPAAQDLTRLKYAQRKYDEVIAVSTEALRFTEDDIVQLELLGLALLRRSKFEAALKQFSKIVDEDPLYAEGHHLQGIALGRLGRFGDAVGALYMAVQLQPQHHKARMVLARFHVESGRFDLAFEEIKKLKRALPDHTEVLDLEATILMKRREFAEAAANLKQLHESRTSEAFAVRLSKAQWMMGEQETAISTLMDFLKLDPNAAEVRAILADYYLLMGRIDNAGAEYDRLLSRQGGSPATRNNYAWVLWKQGLIEAAREQAERALDESPNNSNILDTLGLILLTAGEVPAAVDVLRRASESAPNRLDIAFHYAKALARSGDQQEAANILDRLLAGNQDFAEHGDAQQLRSTLTN